MISGQAFVIAAAFGLLWYAGHETIKGVKKFDHALSNKLHHKKKTVTDTIQTGETK